MYKHQSRRTGSHRVAKHERLQAEAKRERETPPLRGIRVKSNEALAAFIKPRIPLAGCLTPRALRSKGKWRVANVGAHRLDLA